MLARRRAVDGRHGHEPRHVCGVQRTQRAESLPARIICFGVTHLPPSYTRILVALCRHVPVHMFQLSATRHSISRA